MKVHAITDQHSSTADTAAIEAFERDGHVLLRSVASAEEIATYRPAITAAAAKYSSETRPFEDRDTYGKAFLQVTNLWTRDAAVREFVFISKFARIAAALLGVERVRLYHDQALFKEPNGGFTPWHQDQYYWPLDTDRTITMWMPLVDIDDGMGMLTFASGSHRSGPIGSLAISDESEAAYEKYIAESGFTVARADSMKAGDATFHLGWTIHSAPDNVSPNLTREVMTIIYFADGARVAEPQNENQAADLAAWLGGRQPGEAADSELNPVLDR
ncbi:MAG: phytanoyl-CoA dioxygenase family protein [Pyrinomonadaceae bacterium]|nr:phytanoyl-CoA dioxygenase family protein [Pyrinomonadaceae bacterium]